MKKIIFCAVIILPLVLACDHSKTRPKSAIVESKVCKPVKANTSQQFGVKGMVCQMACGGSIRRSLKETCGVESVQIDFVDSLEEQQIVVNYDRNKIAPKQMITVLSAVNKGQFSVRTIGSPQRIK
jgi:copper chaperone CopZ